MRAKRHGFDPGKRFTEDAPDRGSIYAVYSHPFDHAIVITDDLTPQAPQYYTDRKSHERVSSILPMNDGR
ncbi:MAG: hypothetical protein ABI857_11735 [Acidobacteriota bacterium]